MDCLFLLLSNIDLCSFFFFFEVTYVLYTYFYLTS